MAKQRKMKDTLEFDKVKKWSQDKLGGTADKDYSS